ncbi:hypothetical protein HQ545_06305 [Candidatus Woesearchaeota archaeon]|nr:hypothetical protein [Candidatus Woesearchaeota archaeon]
MYKRKLSLILIILFVCMNFVHADEVFLTDTLKIGFSIDPSENTKSHEVDENSYTLQLIICNKEHNGCSININGNPTGNIAVSETYDLDENHYIKIDSIVFGYCDESRFCNRYYDAYDILTFSIYSKLPLSEEREYICGDEICSFDETCKQDNCCWGETVNFRTDLNHCGDCSTVCGIKESCIDGKCVAESFCGDDSCQKTEDCSSCSSDCKCSFTERCEKGDCITYCGNNICESNENCESCQQDCACKESKKCVKRDCITLEKPKPEMIKEPESIPKTESVVSEDINIAETQKENITSETDVTPKETKKGVFRKILDFFRGLFN